MQIKIVYPLYRIKTNNKKLQHLESSLKHLWIAKYMSKKSARQINLISAATKLFFQSLFLTFYSLCIEEKEAFGEIFILVKNYLTLEKNSWWLILCNLYVYFGCVSYFLRLILLENGLFAFEFFSITTHIHKLTEI